MRDIRSPLRYPGGKSKAISKLLKHCPTSFSEYREPFVGGGSVFIYLRQKHPEMPVWINDLNYDLYCFWKQAQSNLTDLIAEIWRIKRSQVGGKKLFTELTTIDINSLSDLERAVRFFVLNRISFSGTVDCGGFSQKAFEARFTDSSIERLSLLQEILDGVVITNLDYWNVMRQPGANVFVYLDPPYFVATKSRLYGKRGDLHTSFDHDLFAKKLSNCNHKWLITYDNSSEIRENFHFANLYEWELQYGMNNYMQSNAAKGRELFITNYTIPSREVRQLSKLFI